MTDKNKAFILSSEATILIYEGKYKEALTKVNESILLDPTNESSWFAKCSCLFALGNKSETKVAVEKALTIVSDEKLKAALNQLMLKVK